MEYGKIISVTGMPGLFELLSSKNDGAIVRALEGDKTTFVSSRIHNFSHLESIEIYTVKENVNLVEIFQAMEKSGDKVPDGKDAAGLKKYFETVYPDIDFERVYTSDLKKMAKWYQILTSNKVELKLTEMPAEDAEPVEEEAIEKPAKKAAKASDTTDEKPAKKAAAKAEVKETKAESKAAKADDSEEAPKKKAAPKAKKEADASEEKEPAKKKAAPKKK